MNLKLILQEVEWIQPAHYCDKWEFLVNTILKFGFRKILGVSSLAEESVVMLCFCCYQYLQMLKMFSLLLSTFNLREYLYLNP